MNKFVKNAKILIVDDEPANVLLLEQTLRREGYCQLKSTTNARQVLPLYAALQPDLLLLDLHMPYITGFSILEHLQPLRPQDGYNPILGLTADVPTKQKALKMGVTDFLSKPFEGIEVLLRTRNLLQTHFLTLQLHDQHHILEQKVFERTQALEEAKVEILTRLARAAEYRDYETGQHTQRVGNISALLAEMMGLPDKEVELIRQAAPLHDVGKIGISDTILLKPARLTAEEFQKIKTHTTIGGRILGGSAFPLLQTAEQIALSHHERWDGTGYPRGLKGEEIPLVGRIVALADVFDALTNERPYKKAWSLEETAAEIKRQSGRQFDPRVVEAFFQLMARGLTGLEQSNQ